jgi:hypothetical protein
MEDLYTYIFIAAVISAFVGNYIAKQKGRSTTEGLLFGFFGGIIGLIIVALLPAKNKPEPIVESEKKPLSEKEKKSDRLSNLVGWSILILIAASFIWSIFIKE